MDIASFKLMVEVTLVVAMSVLERQVVMEEPVILVVEEDQDTLMDLSPWYMRTLVVVMKMLVWY